ncbi:MAG: cyclic beta,2-glucan synthetase [Acidobacteriota bacterium]|jgi:cyclic beta-1,2-glucan synthetase|nr:cyclic beta,2-glucan synthetase [Acidobacteriota bacterium]
MAKLFPSLFRNRRRTSADVDEEPIRGELYSIERLEQFAASLATEHKVSTEQERGRQLLPRLEENGRKLIAAYRSLGLAISNERTISPAAEWLVDNFHIVEEQLREIREDLPRSYYYELPKLTEGELAGYPRIYAIALALVAHTDSRLDAETLRRFIRAYQRESALTIGEVWALAISLRLALVENLRRLTTRVVRSREEREEADALADRLLGMTARPMEELVAVINERWRRRNKLGRAFIVHLVQRLRDQDPAVMAVIERLEQHLAERGSSTEQLVHEEHQRQATAQVTVGNIITSMRLLSTLDWRDFFEEVSLVDPILGEDPAGAYARMEFASRDRYRHVIERISKRTRADELKVARRAVELAARSQQTESQDERHAHVGYYLIDDGVLELEKEFDYRPRLDEKLTRAIFHHPTLVYLGTLTLLTALIAGAFLYYAYAAGAPPLLLIACALVVIVPASDLALGVLNWDVTRIFHPRVLPRMDTSKGIPEDAHTFVVIPTLFTSEDTVHGLLEKLEVHYLANQDESLSFALLGDFADAPSEEMPDDEALLEVALRGIEDLNARYGSEETKRFFLFHRRRQWNESEGKWLGWERKRGKLQEFNHLLRGARETSFIVSTADQKSLAGIRYVITLDSDTQLPRDTARRLVGTITHPLNRPRLDATSGRVTEGYAILQPRVSISLTSASGSRFARVFSGNTGIDPYTTAVSDVYQDVFGEGSYTGKGLYDVDAFERALADRVPENSLLSHDLFESLYARAALVTDLELLDDYPAYYDTYAKRQHRWTRGDWQIARWLMPTVRDAHRQKVRNQLPLVARWKIFDNLRRSLVAPTLLLWLVIAWTILPGSFLIWTTFVLLVLAFPVYAHVTTSLLIHPRGIPWTSHFWSVWGDIRTNTAQVALTLTFLAHQSYLMMDAIARTVYRKLISHKHLLEWVTAAQAETASKHDRKAYLRFMWPAELLVASVLALIFWLRPGALAVAAPFLIAWALSPLIAHWISRHVVVEEQVLTARDARESRRVARRIWRFFETFAGQEDNWLPPDNFQEDPQPVIAHRTSPTNIGLQLLSTIAAYDFGYTGNLEVAERLGLTFTTLKKLQKFRGHFFNWYDTRTLEPLVPQYVSTVDSGNLAGHLIAVKQGCLDVGERPLFDARLIKGLSDTIDLLREEVRKLDPVQQRTQVVTIKELRKEVETCASLVATTDLPQTLTAWGALFEQLAQHAAVIEDIVGALSQEHGSGNFEELHYWVISLLHQTRAVRRDLNTLTPWAGKLTTHFAHVIKNCSPEVAARWQELAVAFDRVPALAEMPEECAGSLERLEALRSEIEACALAEMPEREAALNALSLLTVTVEEASAAAKNQLARLRALVGQCDQIVDEMDFRFLLDEERKVFVIGYNVTDGRRDNSFYDLLASESRLTSFIAIAKGDVPQEHWFRLGRQLTPVGRSRALVSWTATMFEYLMPLLVMRDYQDTLLGETYRAAVARQIEYGAERHVPWGISESAYNARDLHLNYQYGPFGVPGLGLKRGLSQELVVAPYATMLAGMIDPLAAKENLDRLAREGALSRYGFYEAIDYTPERVPQNQKRVIIQAFMAHHQGMSMVAIDNVLNGQIMQERFHADPLVQATELLLQERIPTHVAITRPRAEEVLMSRVVRGTVAPVMRRFGTADLPTPRVQLLSNGTYSVMVTTAGAGYSVCGALAVTRWREDVTRDHWGSFCYLRDVRTGAVWSAGFQPTNRAPASYEVSFAEDKAEFWRRDAGILTHTEMIVSPEDNAEVRRVSVTNQSSRVREIELTSYMEVVLAPPAADAAHPAFSNLFVETEFIASENALLARRRTRSEKDEVVWGIHTVVTEGEAIGAVQYETDRSRFLGRGHEPSAPVAVMEDRPLSNTVGTVLDPAFCLRQRVRLKPNETARVSFATAVAHSHEEALRLADKYHDTSTFEREARLAWTQSKVEMLHLNMDPEEAHLFQRLAGRLLYSDPSLRPGTHVLSLNTKAQSALWPYGISGDLPIVLIRIGQAEELDMVRQILRGHEYLRLKGLSFDLVILNDRPLSYTQELNDDLQTLIRKTGSQALLDKPGGVYLRRTDIMPEADRILLHTVARVVIVTDRGSLDEQLVRRPVENELPPSFVPRKPSRTYPEPVVETPKLKFFNGLGGFNPEGREYVTILGEGQWTPAPWLNVISNGQDFGFQVTETGAGFTWSINSRENRLTPWSNDAVSDPPGEVLYLRDEDTGTVWTPTPLPIREAGPHVIRHGQGYTVFERTSHGLAQELLQFVPLDAPVKVSLLRLRNQTERKRRLSVTSYNELVLGVGRSASAPFIITEVDEQTGTITARNPYNNEFATRVAFVEMSERSRSVTCDRKEFIGRNGSLDNPAALSRARLSGRSGAGLDPCAAMQAYIELAPGESRQIVVLLGEADNADEARSLASRFNQVSEVNQAFERVINHWDNLLSTVEVHTPDAAMDTLLNRWLLYQTLACRIWSRSAFYQSGGAYGFRDQLQDVMALVYSRPTIAREQIVRAASRQFKEGDVQHWWHPPTGRGVRTRFSDDLLWLPYVTNFYIEVTGDSSVLDEVVPFIEAPLLAPDESEAYIQPTVSTEKASVYEHCARALDRSLLTGAHGLPLMGSGDWNDGMNRVGHLGKGESIWVGWFLHTTLGGFSPFCEARNETKRAAAYRLHMTNLKKALEEDGWDGDWYRRAYFDDGTPLGSAENEECRIDSIVQSWGVISGVADRTRAHRAMSAVEEYLIRRGDGLVILFTPPFDRSAIDPGYIKGYVPGVRENGGQYTHAALWTLIAYAKLGDGDRAGELFALLNPISHASTRAGLHKYKAEPYVAAGDVYAVPPHTGRGGWTWYTGSSSWMYRAGLESILGFELHGERLRIEPCIPRSWRGYEINYRRKETRYAIKVENPYGVSRGVAEVWLDDVQQATLEIPLADDGKTHNVRVVLGEREPTPEEEARSTQAQTLSGQAR